MTTNKCETLLYCFMLTYNKEQSLENSIKSVLSQKTKYSYKLIIVDDCSTDNSLKIAMNYQSLYPDKIEVVHNDKNMGILRSTFNCYKMLRGVPYFCFLDADDLYINNTHFERCIDFLEKNKNYSVYLTNVLCEKDNGIKSLLVSEKVGGRTFKLCDYMNDKGIFVQTSGQFFRNVVFDGGMPKSILDLLKSDYARAYEADSFRLPLHLIYGDAVYDPSVDSVYNMVGGVWTNMNDIEQGVFNAIMFCCEFPNFFTEYKTQLISKGKNLFLDVISRKFTSTNPEIISMTKKIFDVLYIQYGYTLVSDLFKIKYKKYKRLFNIMICISIMMMTIIIYEMVK